MHGMQLNALQFSINDPLKACFNTGEDVAVETKQPLLKINILPKQIRERLLYQLLFQFNMGKLKNLHY